MKIIYVLMGFCLGVLLVFSFGCASGPRNMKEMHPYLPARDGDSRILIVIEGEVSANIDFLDQATRKVTSWDEAGASPLEPKFNGQRRPRLYTMVLGSGNYGVKVYPFYYGHYFEFPNPLPKKKVVPLDTQNLSVFVGRKADQYDSQYTRWHWRGILRINTGEIPRTHFFGPQINLTGTGLPGLILDWLGGRR